MTAMPSSSRQMWFARCMVLALVILSPKTFEQMTPSPRQIAVKVLALVPVAMMCFGAEEAFAGAERNDPALTELFPLLLTNWNGATPSPKIPMLPDVDKGRLLFTGSNWWSYIGTNLALPFLRGTNGTVTFAERKLLAPGVYIVMNGCIFDPDRVRKNREKNRFESM